MSLGTVLAEAVELASKMRASGMGEAEITGALEQTLRAVWPKGSCACPRCRWVCRECEDTGAIIERQPARIYGGRLVDVAVPCHCEKGRWFRPKSRTAEDAIANAARTRPMTRVGR